MAVTMSHRSIAGLSDVAEPFLVPDGRGVALEEVVLLAKLGPEERVELIALLHQNVHGELNTGDLLHQPPHERLDFFRRGSALIEVAPVQPLSRADRSAGTDEEEKHHFGNQCGQASQKPQAGATEEVAGAADEVHRHHTRAYGEREEAQKDLATEPFQEPRHAALAEL